MADPEQTPFDIDATADRVVALLNNGQGAEAMRLLEQERQNQPQSVQEALDRMVAHRGEQAIADLRIRAPNIPEFEPEAAIVNGALTRLDAAAGPPRFPSETEMSALTATQRYDVYASIVEVRGNDAARDDLNSSNRVILGLRQENATVDSATTAEPGQTATDDPATDVDESRRGTGVYDDRIVVLGQRNPEGGGEPEVWEFDRATTEPTAQYDERAQGEEREEPYTDVRARRIEGQDANADGVADLGRLAEGTYEMWHDDERGHWNPRDGNDGFDLRPTADAVADNQEGVQRDTNGDGLFTADDPEGTQPLNDTFKIHYGSLNNTDSAGCQTIRGQDYYEFMDAVRGNPDQTNWQYVLTSTTEGEQRTQGVEAPRVEPMETSPRPQPRPDDAGGDGAPQESLRPQPRPPGLGASGAGLPQDELMEQIARAFDESDASRGLDKGQRDNVLAAAYRAFAPSVDHVGVYGGQLVGTRAPHGLGVEPMDNIPVGIAATKDMPAQATLAAAQREHDERQFIPPTEEQRGMGARV